MVGKVASNAVGYGNQNHRGFPFSANLFILGVLLGATSPISFAQERPGEPPSPLPVVSAPPAPPPTGKLGSSAPETPKANLLEGIIEVFDYDPVGKRDPFAPFQVKKSVVSQTPQGPILPLQRFELDELKVVGIIWDVPNPKAIIQTKDGKIYYIGLNDKLGKYNGYVAAIREGEIVVIEAAEIDDRLIYQSRILKLQKD